MQARLFDNLPHTARLIPLPVVASILGVFVLLIGPGEWFVLGWVRRRRWTWITFPAIAAGCTLLTVRAAEHYLGTHDQQVALVITDFFPDGRALRENRVELSFAGRNQETIFEAHQTLLVPIRDGLQFSSMASDQLESIYQGNPPAHYTLRHQLRQWTPYLQRSLTFVPNPTTPHLHWEALKSAPDLTHTLRPVATGANGTANLPRNASELVAERIGAPDWQVRVYQSDHLVGTPSIDGRELLGAKLSFSEKHPASRFTPQHPSDFRGSWVTALSPTGQPDLLDLGLDHADDDLVIVAGASNGPGNSNPTLCVSIRRR